MLVDIIGSSEQLVNEYRVMLAEKLLNKIDYDIETEIRTVELLKVNSISFFTLEFYLAKLLVYFLHCCQQIHFGEASMQRCEIMLNDLIDSKRVNTNIKKTSQTGYISNLFSILPMQCGFLFEYYMCSSLSLGAEVVESELSVDILTSKILSTNFWPPIQVLIYSSF